MYILTIETIEIDPAARLERGYDLIQQDFRNLVADPEIRKLADAKGTAEFTIDLTSILSLTIDPMRLAALAAYAIGGAVLSDVDGNRKDS